MLSTTMNPPHPMVGVEDDAMRGVTWVRVQGIASGE
jgi:hypothetical protein